MAEGKELKMHTRFADALALSTGQGGGLAFFGSSASSFFIGILRKPPAMVQPRASASALPYQNSRGRPRSFPTKSFEQFN